MPTGRVSCKNEGKDMSDKFTYQPMPNIASKPPEAKEKSGTNYLSQPSEGTNLDLRLLAPTAVMQ
jgi:hypothetical protein